ncbi:MAG: sigma-54-dependent Fis family transcriptional regulator [bacterium]|nr:sigma-54-dependent Fis family transcriptional regulator [bacterium]
MDLSILKNVSLLYAEDDPDVHKNILMFLKLHFDTIYAAHNGEEGWELFQKHRPDVVLSDILMPGMDGLRMSRKIKQASPDTPIIILSAFYEADYLMKSIDIGIDKYVRKPADGDKLLDAIYKSALPLLQEKEIEELNEKIFASLEAQISKSERMKDVIKRVHKVAKSDFSVIIHGETGVGKSFVAKAIHDLSHRSSNPFVTVDIGAIPETLVESELFGHMKGAFTGADKNKKGYFEIASGGTLLLEDLENMSLYAQSKLLRAVEDRKIYPLGSTTPIAVDIRLIGATNKDIFEEVKKDNFREDLFYRLCEFDINIPPLRERPEDVAVMAAKFADEVSKELDKKIIGFADEGVEMLKRHYWKGNVRELKNIMRRAVLLCEEEEISTEVIERILSRGRQGKDFEASRDDTDGDPSMAHAVEEAEKEAIRKALLQTRHKKLKAASLLQIDYKTLAGKLKKYDMK